jgi:NAD(P)-dependent dehydrogenase (short-subunit alcohol dehydrogenase family)
MTQLTILTGTTRGLGAVMATQLAQSGEHLVTLSRVASEALAATAKAHGTTLTQINVDLGDTKALEQAAAQLKPLLAKHTSVRFIHNAGVVTPIAQSQDLTDIAVINQAFQVNITSAIYLTAFVLAGATQATDLRVMLISSGAGRNASSGWGVYCATKAAMDRYAEVAQLDQGKRARIVSMAPGMIDTPMQEKIRATSKNDLPSLDRFLDAHSQQKLATPEGTATRLLKVLASDVFGAKTIDDVREHNV